MSKRENKIIEILHQYGNLSVEELSDLLEASPSSIRRDLISLNQNRFIKRTHGGISLSTVINYEPLWYRRTPVDMNEARAIARKAATLIHPGDIIGLSGGVVCTQLAFVLRLLADVTVVTNAINIAAELVYLPGIQLRLTGGRLNPGSFELVGRALKPSLSGVHIQKFFLGTDGLSTIHGVTGHDEAEADAARIIMKHSDETIILADSSKFRKTSFSQVAPLDDFSRVVSTDRVPENVREEFEGTGIKILIASQ
ncbi:DeoR/GlpR family DNA-binding transcription regulator [Chloroflexota bacterium]